MPILLKFFQIIRRRGNIPKPFHEVSVITLIPKPEKDTIRKENYRPVSLMLKLSTNTTKLNSATCLNIILGSRAPNSALPSPQGVLFGQGPQALHTSPTQSQAQFNLPWQQGWPPAAGPLDQDFSHLQDQPTHSMGSGDGSESWSTASPRLPVLPLPLEVKVP